MSSLSRQALSSEIYACVSQAFKQKLRVNYKEMLIILKSFYAKKNDTSVTEPIELTENMIELWFNEIYPLMFDKDREIQLNAIELIPSFIEEFNKTNCDFKCWPDIKYQLINDYVKKLIEVRNNEDIVWCQIWNILIKTISTDLISKAVIINKFLQIVEYAFRSERIQLKIQAYICWKYLIELFAKKNEIHLAKRIRLLLIPFKTSKIISAEVSEVKFRAYWCFLTKQNREILNEHVNRSDILIPFLDFLFGPLRDEAPLLSYLNKDYTKLTSCKIFNELTPFSVFALISLIGTPNEIVLNLMKKENIECESNLITVNVFKIMGHILINACSEATVVLSNYNHENSIDLCKCLWMNLLYKIDLAGKYDLFLIAIDNIHALIKLNHENKNFNLDSFIIMIIKLICSSQLYPFNNIETNMDSSNIGLGIKTMTKLLLRKDLVIKNSELDVIINNLYNFNSFISLNENANDSNVNSLNNNNYWNLMDICINLLISLGQATNNNENYTDNKITILTKIWLKLNSYLFNYLNSIDYNTLKHEEYLFYKYMSWPIVHFDKINKDLFRKNWSIKINDPIFCNKLCNSLCRTIIPMLNKNNIDDIIKFYDIILKALRPNIDDFMPNDVFELLHNILKIQSPNNRLILFMCLELITLFTKSLNDKQAELMVPIFIKLITNLNQVNSIMNLNYVKDFKKFLITKYKNDSKTKPHEFQNKINIDHLLIICKIARTKKDEFVVIDKVWNMDPNKLTEHQKEKMKARRTDIPALYNNLSQSNDTTTLKPWTPNKMNGATTSELVDNNKKNINTEVTNIPTENILKNSLNTVDQLAAVSAKHSDKTVEAITTTESTTNITNDVINNEPGIPNKINGTTTLDKEVTIKPIENILNNQTIINDNNKNNLNTVTQLPAVSSEEIDKSVAAVNKKPEIPNKINGKTTSEPVNNDKNINQEMTIIPIENILNNQQTIIDNNKNNLNIVEPLAAVSKDEIDNTNTETSFITDDAINNNNNNNKNNNKTQQKKLTEKIPIVRKQTRLRRSNNNLNDLSINDDVPLMSSPQDVLSRVEQLDIDEKRKKRVFYELQKLQIIGIPGQGNTNSNNKKFNIENKRCLRSKKSPSTELQIISTPAVVKPDKEVSNTKVQKIVVSDTIVPEKVAPESVIPKNVPLKLSNSPEIIASESVKNKKHKQVKVMKQNKQKQDDEHVDKDDIESSGRVTPEKNLETQEKFLEKYSRSPTIVLPKLKFTSNDGKILLASTASPLVTKSDASTTVPNNEHIAEKIICKNSIKNNLNEKFMETNIESSESFINKVDRKILRSKNELLEARLLNKKLDDTYESDMIVNDSNLTQSASLSTTETPLNIITYDKKMANMDTAPFDSDAINTTTDFNPNTGDELITKKSEGELQLDEQCSASKKIKLQSSPENNIIPKKGNINDMDTELNTEPNTVQNIEDIENVFDDLIEMEKTPSPSPPPSSKPSLPSKIPVNLLDDSAINDDPMTVICKNTSIHSSPELNDINERTEVFLNDTLNISPISIESPATKIQLSQSQIVTSDIKKNVLNKDSSYQSAPSNNLANENLSPHTMNIMESLNRQKRDCASPSARKQLLMPPRSSPTGVRFLPAGSRGAQFVQLAMHNLGQSTPKQINIEKKNVSPSTNTKMHGVKPESFVFNNHMPSPNASPSCSILKRKMKDETVEDVIESPAQKRKRVSFHDPPVSALKEFTRHIDEIKVLGSLSPLTGQNYSNSKLVRKSRRDSIQEIENLSSKTNTKENHDDCMTVENIAEEDDTMIINVTSDTTGMESLRINSTIEESISDDLNEEKEEEDEEEEEVVQEEEEEVVEEEDEEGEQIEKLEPSDLLIQSNKTKPKISLQDVFKDYTLEDLIEYHRTTPGNNLNSHLVHTLTKEISTLMKNNNKIKNNVLEELSEKHSVEFLQHAVQENSSDVVCNLLTPKVFCDYLYKNSMNNTVIKNDLINLFTNYLDNEISEFSTSKMTTKSTLSSLTIEENLLENKILNYVKEKLKYNKILKLDLLNELLLKNNNNNNNEEDKKLFKNFTLKCLYKYMKMEGTDVNDALETMDD